MTLCDDDRAATLKGSNGAVVGHRSTDRADDALRWVFYSEGFNPEDPPILKSERGEDVSVDVTGSIGPAVTSDGNQLVRHRSEE